MTELDMQSDVISILEMVGDLELPCDYAGDREQGWPSVCKNEKAEWILYLTTCTCGVGGRKLACTRCKENRESEDAVECDCGIVTAPARYAYSFIEFINKGPCR